MTREELLKEVAALRIEDVERHIVDGTYVPPCSEELDDLLDADSWKRHYEGYPTEDLQRAVQKLKGAHENEYD